MKANFLAYWNSRSPRDRAILAGVGALAIVALAWAYAWQPITAARLRLRAELPQLRGAAAEMQQAAADVQRLRGLPQPESKDGVAAAKAAADAAGIDKEAFQFAALGPNRVQANAPGIAFDNWLGFIQQLQSSAFGRVETAQVSALAEPGMVRVQAVFVFPAR